MAGGWKTWNVDESVVIGKTPTWISASRDEIHMKFSDGSEDKWLHEQDCCESVSIVDVNGDWSDLVGKPLLVCEWRTNSEDDPPEYPDSFTWTFYTYRGIGGSVDVRWLGESNGYYSEGVDLHYKEASNAL